MKLFAIQTLLLGFVFFFMECWIWLQVPSATIQLPYPGMLFYAVMIALMCGLLTAGCFHITRKAVHSQGMVKPNRDSP